MCIVDLLLVSVNHLTTLVLSQMLKFLFYSVLDFYSSVSYSRSVPLTESACSVINVTHILSLFASLGCSKVCTNFAAPTFKTHSYWEGAHWYTIDALL